MPVEAGARVFVGEASIAAGVDDLIVAAVQVQVSNEQVPLPKEWQQRAKKKQVNKDYRESVRGDFDGDRPWSKHYESQVKAKAKPGPRGGNRGIDKEE
ncbi:hypothetical protein QQS21_003418 [Conoideocrella luteorostrata]|uniref:Uncharacterized protein n=1 Tax=Conoideocrella luteorostrata TaxID=1105319 RepID=A0AAJ0CTB2_9HYPO|nr:hypothetical protein QQS21_003418 [Conoideocrella luteorostrata]